MAELAAKESATHAACLAARLHGSQNQAAASIITSLPENCHRQVGSPNGSCSWKSGAVCPSSNPVDGVSGASSVNHG